uniref:Integrase core domain containing protein n=1 Tax=Solanum tuberosum TaxID=4113 RepID=M1DE95_SOLTU
MIEIIQSGSFERDTEQRETFCGGWHKILQRMGSTLSGFELLAWADNMVTWDQAVMLADIMAGLDIDVAHILIAKIHKRVFKCHRFDLTSDADEDHRLNKKKCQQLEDATRKSMLDEERRQQQAREVDIGPSGTSSTTDGASMVGESAIDGTPSVDPVFFGTPDPPTS